MDIRDVVASRNLAMGLCANVRHFFQEERAETLEAIISHVNFFGGEGFPMNPQNFYKYAKQCAEVEHFLFFGDDGETTQVIHLNRFLPPEDENIWEVLFSFAVVSRVKGVVVSQYEDGVLVMDAQYDDIYKVSPRGDGRPDRAELDTDLQDTLTTACVQMSNVVDEAWEHAAQQYAALTDTVFRESPIAREEWRPLMSEWSLGGFASDEQEIDIPTLLLRAAGTRKAIVYVHADDCWLLMEAETTLSARARMLSLAFWGQHEGALLVIPGGGENGVMYKGYKRGNPPFGIAASGVLLVSGQMLQINVHPDSQMFESAEAEAVCDRAELADLQDSEAQA